jgi:hypothetical protein
MKPMEIFIIGTVAMHVDTISLESWRLYLNFLQKKI